MPANKPKKIEIENITSPGHITRVDADKYEVMRNAFLKVLPSKPPGLRLWKLARRYCPISQMICFPAEPRRAGGKRLSSLTLRQSTSCNEKQSNRSVGIKHDDSSVGNVVIEQWVSLNFGCAPRSDVH
jgi:hypothetical protein